ncbi:MAG: aldo/keto reductase [Myxococcales bacterium FL481]|nr:MAG: aldo/keto reductase [Myxococcales bacterium FL481]
MTTSLRYRLLGPSGLRVSEISLGTMSFGEEWGFGADSATSHAILNAYAEAGGNFIDTANKYHNGETEEIVGAWLPGKRDKMVVATKYTLSMDHSDPNASGSHRKNLVRSVDASLRRLNTDYIDLLWVHAWDDQTSWQETMRALDDVVRSGKVLYIGISDTPAWVVSASQVTAELSGWSTFAALQLEFSLIQRTPERDLLPMARKLGLSVVAWAPLGGGLLTGKYTRANGGESLRRASNEARGRTAAHNLAVARAVDDIADALGVSSTQVALAWIQSRGYAYLPLVGARTVAQIVDSLGATAVRLDPAHLERLEHLSAIELGFPHDFLASSNVRDLVHGEVRTRVDTRPER